MLESFPVALGVAAVLGFLSGIGVGGGSLLILWLTLVVGMAYPQARQLNLLFFLPAAAVASLFRLRRGQIRLCVVLPAALCGCVASILLTHISAGWDLSLLRKAFGFLLVFTGIREIFVSGKNRK